MYVFLTNFFLPQRCSRAVRIVLWLFVFSPCFLTAGFFEYDFAPVWRAEYAGILARDLDGDGVDELVMSRKNEDTDLWGVSCTDITGGARWQYWPKQRTEAVDAADIDDDGEIEVMAREKAGDTAFLLVFTKDGGLTKRMKVLWGADIKDPAGWDGGFGFKGMMDLNLDGKKELLLSAGTSFDLQPRGVFVIDPRSGKELWHYWVGFYPNDIKYDDLDGDGDLEIVMGGASPANGGEINGTDDLHTYVVVLDNEGRLLWKKQIGGLFSATRIEIADFNNDGEKEIVVIETTDYGNFHGQDRIIILDGITGKEKRVVKKGHTYMGSLLCDINKDGIPEIVVGNSDGVLRAYDGNLKEVAHFKYSTGIRAADAGDIDDDGRPEIIAASLDGKLHVLSARLRPMGSFEVGGGYEVGGEIVSDKEGGKGILFHGNQPDGEVEFFLLKISKKLSNQAIILIVVSPLVLALLVVAGFIIPVLYRRNKLFKKTLDKSSTGIIILSSKGQIRIINKTARDLLGLGKEAGREHHFKNLDVKSDFESLQESILGSISLEEPRRYIMPVNQGERERLIEIQTFKTGAKLWLVSLSDVTDQEYGRRMASLMPVAQQLAHGIKNPLNNIKLALDRLKKFITTGKERQVEAAQYSTMAADEAERLVKLTNGFLRFTKLDQPEFKPAALEPIVKEVVARFRQMLSKDIEISVALDRNLPKLMLDRAQISIALDHLVDNAIAAIEGKGVVTIKASLCEEASYPKKAGHVELSVVDTGRGIPHKYKARIFEPYFSMKEGGTGLGLCMVKKLVENHNGTVSFESAEGQGTTFTIRLPL